MTLKEGAAVGANAGRQVGAQLEGPGAGSPRLDSGDLHARSEPPAPDGEARRGQVPAGPRLRRCSRARTSGVERLELGLILTSPPATGERKHSLRT